MLLVFVAIPLLEIALLIKIGQAIGFWATILLVIGTAALGTWLLHTQGLETLRRVLTMVDAGKPPVAPVLDGFLLLVAGLLLLTPGIITDTLGFILLIPPVRNLLVRLGLNRLLVVTVGGRTWSGEDTAERSPPTGKTWPGSGTGSRWRSGTRQKRPPAGEGPIIEGEYERLEERTVEPDRDHGKR